MGEWQPIETAPKDGTDILLFIPDFANWPGDARIVSVCWSECGWWQDNGAAGCNTWGHPTHWQHLPTPPEKEPS